MNTYNVKKWSEYLREGKEKRLSEMRDRYLPPGEDPSDPTEKEEMEYNKVSSRVEEILDSIIDSPGQIKNIDSTLYAMYDDQGEQFFVFNINDADIYYKDKRDYLSDMITDRIIGKEDNEGEY